MHNEKLEPKAHPYKIMFGQRPLTRFKDYRKAIKVDLLYAPPRKQVLKGIYNFVKATWSDDGMESEKATTKQMSEALSAMLEGKALGLGIECMDFIYRIGGITRVDTHQIVRNRVGITYSQQCTGDRFLNHNDVLIEECMAKDPKVLDMVISATLHAKNAYAEMCDSQYVSIQAAREILPHNLETFIFVKINLMTLLQFYKKRIDDGSQTWSMNIIAQQMADAVCKEYPELKPAFEKSKTSFRLQTETSKDRKNMFSTSLYIPLNDTEFEYNNRDFLYSKKKSEMNYTNTPIKDSYYWGFTEVDEKVYNQIKNLYEKMSEEVDEKHLSNQDILNKLIIVNSYFDDKLKAKN